MRSLVWPLVATAAALAGPAPTHVRQPGVQPSPRSLASQLEEVRTAARRLRTPDMARKDGYHPIAPRWLRHNLNPLLGEHWVNERYLRGGRISLQHPAFLMFHPAGGREVLVGVAYGLLHDSTHVMPDMFQGSLDRWHVHWPCLGIPGLGSTLANDAVDCRRLGGHPAPSRLAMVHVWLTPNPSGVFAPDNPALPYAAIGLRPPTPEDLLSPSRGRRARLLALALGETYGATPRLGSLVEARPDTAFARKVARHRTAIRAMVPGLRDAENRGDLAGFDRLASAAIAEWQIIGQAYLAGALNEVHRRLLHRWMVSAIDPEADHSSVHQSAPTRRDCFAGLHGTTAPARAGGGSRSFHPCFPNDSA